MQQQQQLSLVYDAASVGASDWDSELGWFRRAVDVLGHKEVAYRLDVQPSNLTDALHERERKNVHGRWISVVRRMASPALLAEHLELICSLHGYAVPKRKKPMTDAEENRAIRELLRTHAPAIASLVDKEIGK